LTAIPAQAPKTRAAIIERDRIVRGGALVDNYYRSYDVRTRTRHAGVTRIYSASLKYRKSGGRSRIGRAAAAGEPGE
jgi:hypothetical protein